MWLDDQIVNMILMPDPPTAQTANGELNEAKGFRIAVKAVRFGVHRTGRIAVFGCGGVEKLF